MGDDGDDPAGYQLAEDLIHGRGEKELGEFDHEVAPPVNGVFAVAGEGALDVLEAQVELAAAVDAERNADGGLQLLDALGDEGGAVGEFEVGVRSGDDVRGAGLGGETEHGEGVVQGGGAIVQAPEDVGMDVYHRGLMGFRDRARAGWAGR